MSRNASVISPPLFEEYNKKHLQSTPANQDTEGTGKNRPDTAEFGLAGVKCINLDRCSY